MLGSMMTGALKRQALDDAKVSLSQYASGVLSPRWSTGRTSWSATSSTGIVERNLAERPDIFSVKVWRTDGVLAWTNSRPGADRPNVSGRRRPRRGHRDEGDAEAHARATKRGRDRGRSPGRRRHRGVRASLRGRARGRSAPTRSTPTPTRSSVDRRPQAGDLDRDRVRLPSSSGSSSSFSRAAPRARFAARRRPPRALSGSQRVLPPLEESSLEAIESLNATVEAKDPYTAGHSSASSGSRSRSHRSSA